MKSNKKWLFCFLIVIMFICSINIGFAFDEDVSDNVDISFEDEDISEEKKFQENVSSFEESEVNILEDVELQQNETDNWELTLVFYDSTVNGGTTPLTEINWDASNGGYGKGESRVITVQINYRNTNCLKTYQPGTLEINIPNLVYNTYSHTDNSPYWNTSIIIGANDSTHTGYEWNLIGYGETHKFRNANIIEAKSNFEGNIQIIYKITPRSDLPEKYDDLSCKHIYQKEIKATLYEPINSPNWPNNYPHYMREENNYWIIDKPGVEALEIIFDNTCELGSVSHYYLKFYDRSGKNITSSVCKISADKIGGTDMAGKTYIISGDYVKITMTTGAYSKKGFSAIVKDINFSGITSNTINLTYYRKYIYAWKRQEYSVSQNANKISSYDGLGINPSNYIWVKYGFKYTNTFTINLSYPSIYANNGIYRNRIPEGCIVYDDNGNLLSLDEDETCYIQVAQSYHNTSYIYVGYPKSIYNEANNNLNITNKVELWGTYNDRTESELLNTVSVNLNLADYEFTYSGDLYSINKKTGQRSGYLYMLYQQDIQRNLSKNESGWNLYPNAIYTGNPMTVKMGDDVLFATSMDGDYVKFEDDEYYFNKIEFKPDNFKNGNNQTIPANKYDCELWIRYKDTDEYVLYESFKNPSNDKSWIFTKEDGIVGFYFMIYDMMESISSSTYLISTNTRFHKQDIPELGKLYNFCYLQVYFRKTSRESSVIQLPR